MTDDKNKRKLYDALSKDYDMGTFEQFSTDVEDEGKRRKLYDAIKGEYDLPDFDGFTSQLIGTPTAPTTQQKPEGAQSVAVKSSAPVAPQQLYQQASGSNGAPVYPYQGTPQQVRPKQEKPQGDAPLGPEKFAKQMEMQRDLRTRQKDFSQRMENIRKGNQPFSPGKVQRVNNETGKVEDVYLTKGGDEVATPFEQAEANKEFDQQAQTRKDIETLSTRLDAMLDDASNRALEQFSNSEEVKTLTDKNAPLMKRIFAASRFTNNNRYVSQMSTPEVQNIKAAQRAVNNAKRVIEEADRHAQLGDYDNWFRGVGRGVAKNAGKVENWDFGLSSLIDNAAVLEALNKADNGEQLTESEQALLDATVTEIAANNYFGSDVSRGYKAGQVTAESLPFMIEMLINPAAGTGKSVSAKVARYALKRFGKEAVAKGGKKYAAATAMKIGGRLIGDVVGATTMTATTGQMGTIADAFERVNDAKMNGKELDLEKAYAQAFKSRTIENYSEMLGNYFSPALKYAGKGIDGLSLTKFGKKVRLDKVMNFVEDVSSNDLAKIITDFEQHAQWHGTIGEYVEEVAGNVLNGIFVGDMTFDTDKDTGIFNLDNNIDTFLGVAVLGGLFSGVKTVGYGAQKINGYISKYDARKRMDASEMAARSAFGDDSSWEAIRQTLAEGNVGEVKSVLEDVFTNPDYSEEQKRAVFDYAEKATAFKGVLMSEQKRRNSADANDEEVAAEQSYDRGYDADEETRRDIFTEFGMAQEGDSDYSEKKAAWDGVVARINDKADEQMAIEREQGLKMKNPDGNIRPVTLKEKDEDGNDKEAFIIDGNVVMMSDGTMVDSEASDTMVVIYDPATGEKHQIPPSSILSVGEPTSWEDYDYELQRRRDEYVQKAMDDAQGTVRVELGQQLTMPDGRQGVVIAISPDGESFTVVSEDGSEEVQMQRSDLQQVYDEYVMTDYQERHKEEAVDAELPTLTEGHVQGAPTEFLPDMEITIVDDEGNEHPAIVRGPVRYNRGKFVTDAKGDIIEYIVGNEVKHDWIEDLSKKVVSYVQEEPTAPVSQQPKADASGTVAGQAAATSEEQQPAGETAGTVAEQPAEPVAEQPAEEPQGERPADDVMPIREDGEADYMATTPERGHQYIYNEAGLSREEAGQFVKANIDAAEKELKKLQGKSPKMGTSITKYQQEKAAHQQQVEMAQRVVDYWNGVKAVQQGIANAEAAEREERDRIAHEAAVLAEQQRQAEELAKQQEQAQRGANAVHTSIREKWDAAPKVEGVENEITLANGETVKGRYMLVESGASTPSHNPNMEFARNEGFPVDENGQTVNDRDYERDQEAQTITRQMGSSYDSRAIQAVPVVSNDGVVLSGNGRTMAGEIAAQQGTDAAYIEHLKKYPQQFGFTPEQVEGMQHPRVVFVPDEAMPYTTDTFAKFNAQDMKSQSRTEQAVKLGKTVDDNTFGRIVSSINSFSTLGDFYNDPKASADAIGELHNAGVINSMQIAEMMDGEKISGVGRQMLENMLIGKAFEGNPDAIRQLSEYPSMRQSVVSALAEIANNIKLGEEYALAIELSQAIDLAYQARKSGIGAGEKVSGFARQGNLFAFDEGDTVADYTNLTVMMLADCINDSRVSQLKKVLALYNDKAASSAAGQFDMFSGGIMTKEEIIKDVLNILNYGTEQEQQSALAGAAERRQATAGIQEDGASVTSGAGSGTGNNDRQGSNGGTTKRGESESNDVDENGYNFVKNEDGSTVFGEVREESGLPAAPIKLSEGYQDGNGKGYGLAHIEANHGKQIREAGFASVEDFVRYVAQNYDEDNIRVGKHRVNGSTSYLIQVTDEHDNTLFIELSKDNSYWNVNSGGIFRKGYSNKKETVAKTEPQQPNNVVSDGSSLLEETGNDIVPSKPNGEPTVSSGKDTKISETDKEKVANGSVSADDIVANKGEVVRSFLVEEANIPDKVKYKQGLLDAAVWSYNQALIKLRWPEVMTYEKFEKQYTDDNGTLAKYDIEYLPNIYEYISSKTQRIIDERRVAEAIESASSEVDTNPTEAQKKAGNYKMGHVTVDGYNITIENPKGSVRRGTDPNGKAWEQEMHNTYGYIRGTEGVDGDHIDVFLSDDPTQGDVFVVDQVDPSTGKFDEHKVMYGFADVEAAKEAYLSNYEEGWKGLGEITHVSKEEFKKWVDSSHRKTKPFSEYSSVASKNKRLEEEYRAKVIGEDIAEGREFGYYYTDGGRKQYHSRSNTDTRIISKADYDYAKAHGGKMFPAGEQKDIEDDNEEQQLRTWFIQQWPHRELEDVIAAIEGSDNALNKQNLPKLKRFKELWDSSHERTRRRASDGEAYKTAEETFNVGDKVIYNGEKYVVNNINKDFGDVRYEIAKTVDSESSQVVEPNELRKDEPAGEAAGTEAGEQKSIFSHPVDVERSRQLRQTLVEAYRGGNREEIQKAVEGIHQYLDEGKDFDSEYSEDVEDYEGNDPEMLADRFITHALHDRYLDTDEDQGYIKTGIRSDVAGEHGNYTITPKQYTTKRGNVLDMHLVKFSNELDAKERRAAIEMAKEEKGWWSREDGGFMMRSEESAKRLAERIMKGGEAVEDAQPLSLQDVANTTDSIQDDNTNNTIEEKKSSQESKESETGEEVKQQSKWVDAEDAERFEELRQRMRQKLLGQMNMGVDPEILAIGIEMSYYVVKHGAKVMRDYAKEMIEILGNEIRPYLKAFYNGVRDMPEMEDMVDELTPYDEVRTFDVMNFDNEGPKDIISLAANVVKEDEASNQAEEATTKLKKQRNDNRKVVESGKQPKYRPATEADLSNGQLYYEGKPVYVMMVVHKGEQVDAQHFSEPEIESIYLTNGKNVKLDDLSVIEVPEKSKKRTAVQQSQLSLFGEEEAPTTEKVETKNKDNDENTNVQSGTSEAGRGGHKPQSNAEVGRSAGNETKRPVDQGVAGRNQAHPGDNGERSGRVSGVLAGDNRVEKPVAEQPKRNLNNNHVERGTDFAPKDVDRRIEANIAAIEKMQELIEDGRQATPKDMEILRKFSGWGGLGKAFQEKGYGYGYDPTATSKRLKALLGDEAYEQANMSRNSAYYTPSYVIDTMWDIARAMGFNGGKVLEGSAGIGNIIGLMPQDMSERSNIQAVEIDSTTGNILKLLYPDAKVDVQGFEATQVENGSIDLAITNVPFVPGMLVPKDTSGDSDLSKKFHNSIQDFCIAKNIRKLREGGIGIFITSSSTLDNSTRLREWIVQEGGTDVVGAFRLNNETFGGTGATSDIIVVRKRVNGKKSPNAIDVLPTIGERTAEYDTGETKKVKGEDVPIVKQLSMDYNKYFVEHPEMMGGEMYFGFEKDNTFRPTSKSLYPVKGKNQSEMLDAFVRTFDGKVWDKAVENSGEDQNSVVYSELGEDVKEGSIVVVNGRLCMAQLGYAKPLMSSPNEKKGEVIGKTITEEELIKRFQDKKVKGHTKVQCFESYKAIKDALASLLEYQTTNDTDDGLQPLLDALNRTFDAFVKTYGHLHKNKSISFLKDDVDYSNILALEKFTERIEPKSGERIPEYGKTDVFTRRVVEKDKAPEPDNVKDGIIASIYVHGRVDLPWIAETVSKHSAQPITEQQVKDEIINTGLGFENPSTRQIEVSYEYLSGNVREKLQQAIDGNSDGRYNTNIKALEQVIPMNIPAHLIDFSIGSSWIDKKLYEDYVKERTDIEVKFVAVGGTWFMKKPYFVEVQKNRAFGIVSEMLHKTIMGTDLIEAAMTNKTITVSGTRRKWDGGTETVVDKGATTACANKIDEIRQDFKDWARGKMQSDPDMSARIERIYNEMFNNYVPRTIPDDFVPDHFGGAATIVDGKPFSLRPHQGKAVVRSTTQPLLLAHEVGTGKTYTLITTAMEMRRIGTARKPMIVVQNATVGQFVESAKKLYPNAKVLTIDDKEHTAEGRKSFYAKIKYNDWDMIVVPQSVFERIPDSEERQMAFVQDKIAEKEMVLEQMRNEDPDGKSMIVRNAEKEIEKLQDELSEHTNNASTKRKERDEKKAAITRQNAEVKAKEMLDRQTDDVENFDDMGIDALLVDEAHEYKHLGFATAMQRGVKGVDPSFSKKAQGVFLKTQAVMEKNNGRNVVFATGTPISNTAAEIWTFMRYLMPADTMKEYGIYYFDDFVRNFGNLTQMLEFTTSGKFKENNRFAGYVNLPELVRIWSGVADTVLTSEAGGVSDKIPAMEGGKAQDIYLPQTKALRSVMKYVKHELDEYDKMNGKEKKEHSYIPLNMYGIAKAAAVDARLVVSDAVDEEQSKTNEAVRQTLKSLEETKEYKGTIAIFADNYQNKHTGFNLYEDIRYKLEESGVPTVQIVVMKSGMTVKKKLEIFDMVNRGDVRVIMGSTFTLGTGVNIQERLHTLIHLDAPNRPMDYTQRNGRILRQGNLHKDMDKPVRVLRFGVEDSLDVTAYQRLKTKAAIADSIMNGKKMMNNSMENRVLEEEEDVFGDTMAQLSGSEYAMLKNQAEKDVRKYENKKKQWEADQTYCHNEIPRLESKIRQANIRLGNVKDALKKVDEKKGAELAITIDKQKFADIDTMTDYIKEFNREIRDTESDMRENPYNQSERTITLKVNVNGFDFTFTTKMNLEMASRQGTLFSAIHRNMHYDCPQLGLEDIPVKQSLLREGLEDIVNNIITGNDFRERIERLESNISKSENELSQVRERDGKPFGFVKELEDAYQHLNEYTELMKKELEEKEKKYSQMDAEVEEATDVTVAEEAEEDAEEDNGILFRDEEDEDEREVQLVDAEKEHGTTYEEGLRNARRAGYNKRQYDAYIERQERNARKQFADLIEKLGLTDRVEVRDTPEGLKGRRAKAKGWYDPTTGKIVIILGNHHSKEDVMKTILHESIGHYGMRKLFGTHFDTFLDNVYLNADAEVRGRIVELAKKHGWNFRTATEEYLAGMAEDTNFEVDNTGFSGWWMKIKELFWDMLHKLGLKVDNLGVKLSDNELRYLLWRSYQNLVNPGRFRSLVDEAKDVVMQNTLKVGQFEEESETEDNEQSEEDLQIVAEAATAAKKRDLAKQYPGVVFMTKVGNHYEATGKDAETISKVLGIEPTTVGVVRFREADLDKALLGMIKAGHRVAVVEKRDPKVEENDVLFRDGDFTERDRAIARDYYERMVSENSYQVQEAMQDSMLGLRKAMQAILGAGKDFKIEEVSGNENAYLAENRMSSKNAAEQHNYFRVYMKPMLKAVRRTAGRKKADREALTNYMMAKHGLERNEKFAERDFAAYQQQNPTGGKTLADFRQNDYSGLTALTGEQDVMDAEAVAQQMVADYESQHDTGELWGAVNAATKVTLAKMYMGGLMSKDSYEHTRDMFDYYIPLRGFDETTSDEVYGYLTSRQGPLGSSILKHAEGRRSKADDPIATISMMADQAIVQANRNEMKQRFLTFVQNHPSDLVSVSKLWLQYDAAKDEWVPVFADIDESDTAADVARKVEAFEKNMEQLAANDPDNYKSGKEAANIPYRVLPGNMKEHQVLVKRAGETFVLTINGNPRAAQALNGLTNPDVKTGGFVGGFMKLSKKINRFLSSAYTTRTPDFVVSNFFRDMLYSNCMVWVKENPRYALTFHKNFGKFNPATMRVLYGKWENGKLDDSKPIEYMFKLFMMNGGETGYTNVRDIEAQKRRIAKELRRQDSTPLKMLHVVGKQLDLVNQSVENCARFAAFITSQELGRSIERSIYDAKEVSVNFNKKGSGDKMMGAKGQSKVGNVAAFLGGAGGCLQVFWNAGVQGMTNFGRAAKRHPGKFTAGAATMFTLGAVIPLLAKAMGDDDDDDKNAYYNLPEYVRRSNICFRAGENWITIPLPIEFRAIYGLGELGTGVITGREHYSDDELARQIAAQVSQILPLDFMEGGGGLHNLWPSLAKPIVEAHKNKGWTGLPIYKDTPWNQNDPEFTKVYKSADEHLVAASRWLNEQTGGDDYKKGWADVVNPAQVEYLLNGYFGGYAKVPNQLVKMAETAFGDRDFEWRNMMIANRLVKSGDERTENRKLTNEYFKYKDEYEETKRLENKYESAAENGVIEYAEKINFLNNSEEYARYLIFDKYREDIDDYYTLQKEEPDEEIRKGYEADYYRVMREMVDEMHAYEKEADK